MSNNIIVLENGTVSIRIDDVYTVNAQYLVNKHENGRYFGSFKFKNPKEAEKTLKEAVKKSKLEDTIFYGQYPAWVEDNYGISFKVGNRVKFYKSIGSDELVPEDEIRDYNYSIEVHFKRSKTNGIFLVVPRAIVTGDANVGNYNDELFNDLPRDNSDFTSDSVNVEDDDLPF